MVTTEPKCVCGSPNSPGIVHRSDGPCYIEELRTSNEYRNLAKEFIRLAPSTVTQELAIQLFAAWLDDRPAAEPAAAPGMVAELAKCVRWLIDDMPGCMIRGEAALAAYHSGTAHETPAALCTCKDQRFKGQPGNCSHCGGLLSPADTRPLKPYGKPCTCDNCLGSSRPCGVDAGEKLGELWYCRKRAAVSETAP